MSVHLLKKATPSFLSVLLGIDDKINWTWKKTCFWLVGRSTASGIARKHLWSTTEMRPCSLVSWVGSIIPDITKQRQMKGLSVINSDES